MGLVKETTNTTSTSTNTSPNNNSNHDELAFQSLQSYVKWHLTMDKSSPDPTEALFAINRPVYEGGKFMHLPFKLWLSCQPEHFNRVFDRVKETWNGGPPEALLRAIGAQYLSPQLLQRLTGPSQPDLNLPPIDFELPFIKVKLYSLEEIMQEARERRTAAGQGEDGSENEEEEDGAEDEEGSVEDKAEEEASPVKEGADKNEPSKTEEDKSKTEEKLGEKADAEEKESKTEEPNAEDSANLLNEEEGEREDPEDKEPAKELKEGDKMGVKGTMAGAVECFMSHFLCNHSNLIECFNHPDAQAKLTPELKLAVGIMREVLILPRFGSMRNFWVTYKQMVDEGGHLADKLEDKRIRSKDILETFKDDQNVIAMYELFQDMGHYIGCSLHCNHYDKREIARARREAGEPDTDDGGEGGTEGVEEEEN